MGFAPPTDAPTPAQQSTASADAGFQPSPTGSTLCGFGLPKFTFSFGFNLPALPFPPPFPPKFNFSLAFNCDLSNPISGTFGFGGGRVGDANFNAEDDV